MIAGLDPALDLILLSGGRRGAIPSAPVIQYVEVVRETPAFTNPSVIRIANIALQRIGATQPIAALDEPSKEARVIRQVWDHLRDLTLQELGWDFARTQTYLAPIDVTFRPWRYCYRLPADCLKPLQLVPVDVITTVRQRIPYQTASNSGGPMLCTDADAAVLEYVVRLIDPNDWPMWFHEHLALRLAVEIAMPLSVNPTIKASVLQDLAQSRLVAAQSNASTGQPQQTDEPSAFLAARGGAWWPTS